MTMHDVALALFTLCFGSSLAIFVILGSAGDEHWKVTRATVYFALDDWWENPPVGPGYFFGFRTVDQVAEDLYRDKPSLRDLSSHKLLVPHVQSWLDARKQMAPAVSRPHLSTPEK